MIISVFIASTGMVSYDVAVHGYCCLWSLLFYFWSFMVIVVFGWI